MCVTLVLVVANLGSGCAIKTSNLKCGSRGLEFLLINTVIELSTLNTTIKSMWRHIQVYAVQGNMWEAPVK